MLSDPHRALEFEKVADLLRRYAPSPLGASRLDRLLQDPRLESAQAAERELAMVGEAVAWLRDAERRDRRNLPAPPRFSGIEDVREPVSRLSMDGVTLEPAEIRAVLGLLESAEATRSTLLEVRRGRPLLGAEGERMPDLRGFVAELAGKILPNDEISSLASSALSRIRRRIEKQRQQVEASLQRFVRRYARSGVLRDEYVTMRNGRTVVPVKAQWKGRVDGIVHGASASGQTVFVEPLDTIVQNNRLVRLHEDEQAEMLRILRRMSGQLREERAAIRATIETVADLEYAFARAMFATDFGCCLPRFGASGAERLILEEARHPLLQDLLAERRRRPVPMTVRLETERRTLIVSGPNAGGKTVVLKTVGLLAAMAQAGVPVPASDAEFPWFDRILADIGDDQSISESLSTFSAHVSKLRSILERASRRTLVVLDELGTATDPEDGGALAVAVVERLGEAGGFTVVSTHLPELKMYGSRATGVVSASMGFDPATMGVTYRLQAGLPGQSAGLDMAERYGMPATVVRRARELKGRAGEHEAAYLAGLQRQASRYEQLLDEARRAERARERRAEKMERDAAERDRESRAALEQRVEQLVNRLERRYQASLRSALRKLRAGAGGGRGKEKQELARAVSGFRRAMSRDVSAALGPGSAGLVPAAGEEYEVGDSVRVASMGVTGQVVRRIGPDRWEVQAGWMKTQVSAADLSPADGPQQPRASLPAGVRLNAAGDPSELPSEVNVMGSSAEEALAEVDKFLDRAVVAGRTRVRVVHGMGKDILRRRLWQMFARHVHVSKYYQAEQHEGGAGATIVELGGP